MTRAFLIGKIYIIAERYVNYCFTNHPYLWDESNFMKMIKKLRIMKGDKLRKHCQIFCPKKWDYRTISDFWKWSKRCLNDRYDRSPCIMAELSFKKKLWRYLGMKAARQAYPRAVKVRNHTIVGRTRNSNLNHSGLFLTIGFLTFVVKIEWKKRRAERIQTWEKQKQIKLVIAQF